MFNDYSATTFTLSISNVAAAEEVDVYLYAMYKFPPAAAETSTAPELVHEVQLPSFVS